VFTTDALERAIGAGDYDVVHCHEPDSLIAALRVKRTTDTKVIFDSHEMWGATFAGRFPRPLWRPLEKVYQAIERRYLRRCDAAIGASWAISDFLTDSLPENRVETILNVPVVEVFGESEGRVWADETILCHDGHLTFNRGLRTMVEAVRIASRNRQVVLKIVGDVFNEERRFLDRFVSNNQLENTITTTGWLPYDQVGAALAPCHIGLIALQKTPNNVVTSSNKVFNYMLYGIPFIGPDFRLSKQKLVREERCGHLADSASPESYAKTILRMIDSREETEEMSQHALTASRQRYRWHHMEPALFALYDRVLGSEARQ
jgi:glycosyltransferase involved in cell wall biosynthesis